MKPLRVVVFDRTDRGFLATKARAAADGTSARGLGLSPIWRLGAQLFDVLGSFDAWSGAHTWAEAIQFAVDTAARLGRPIDELQAWGHGGFGFMLFDRQPLNRDALAPASELARSIDGLRDALAPNALVWLRCCSAFGHARGRDFAPRLAERLRARVAGHTFIIHALQSGTHSLGPGDSPAWDEGEGVHFEGGEAKGALSSSPLAPNTTTFLAPRLPPGF